MKEFLDAYKNDKNLVKCTAPKWKKDDYDERWSKTSGRTSVREGTERAHPRTYEPEGRRYKVNTVVLFANCRLPLLRFFLPLVPKPLLKRCALYP